MGRTVSVAAAAARMGWDVARAETIATVVLGVLGGASAAPAAALTAGLVNDLTDHAGLRKVVFLATLIQLMAIASIAASYLAGIAQKRMDAKVATRTETTLAATCASLTSVEFLDSPDLLDDLTLARRGASEAPLFFSGAAVQVASSITTVASFAIVLLLKWPAMLLILLCTAIPGALLQRRIMNGAVRTARDAAGFFRWSSYYSDLFTRRDMAREMRAYGSSRVLLERLQSNLETGYSKELLATTRTATTQAALSAIGGIVSLGGMIYVVAGVVHGRASVGQFVLFTLAVSSVQQALYGILSLRAQATLVATWFRAYLDFTRLANVNTATRQADALSGQIEFDHVWFSYPGQEAWALQDVCITVHAGQRVALVGANGAGKTTVVQLLMRFYEPTRGRILWDGTDIRNLDPASLRQRISLVLQDRTTYDMTAVEAITIGNAEMLGDEGLARRAAELANAHEFIEHLPHGYDTMLSSGRSDGTTLSGGQWQRVSVARSMTRHDADLFIMDEPNSGLDPLAEEDLHQRIMQFGQGTCVLVSHRLGAVKHADVIYVLDEGRVVGRGPHRSLVSAPGLYARMFHAQANALSDAEDALSDVEGVS